MFNQLKTLLTASAPPHIEVTQSYQASQLRHMTDPMDTDELFGDLPRLVNPRGIDDTDEIQVMIIQAFPELVYCPDQTVNRRKLYMSIHSLRTQTTQGWVKDQFVEKGDYAQDKRRHSAAHFQQIRTH